MYSSILPAKTNLSGQGSLETREREHGAGSPVSVHQGTTNDIPVRHFFLVRPLAEDLRQVLVTRGR